MSIRLDDELWATAAVEQGARALDDPYLTALANRLGSAAGKIFKIDVYRLLELPVGQRHTGHERRIGEAMRALGWCDGKLRRDGSKPQSCFLNTDEPGAPWLDVKASDGQICVELTAERSPQLKLV